MDFNLSDPSQSHDKFKLVCWILPKSTGVFAINIGKTQTVSDLKVAIKKAKELVGVDTDTFDIWKLSSPIPSAEIDAKLGNVQTAEGILGCIKLNPLDQLLQHFSSPSCKHLHIVVQFPSRKRFFPSPTGEDNHGNKRKRIANSVIKKGWIVNGAIREMDTNRCYYLDPWTQNESSRCLNAVSTHQLALLWGARASGKTTRLLWLRDKLEAQGYWALYISFDRIQYNGTTDMFWKSFGKAAAATTSQDLPLVSSRDEFFELFRMDAWDRDVVLLVDALDQLYDAQPAVQDECLQAFCDIQNSNNVPIRSVIAAGTLSVLHLNPRGSTVSPFNVANHIQTPYFTVEEVKKLFDEFAHDYHITIDDAVVQDIWAKSNGHPAMVCLCGRAIFKNLQSLVDGDSILSDRSWQRFPAHNLYHAISAYNTFDSMLLSLARSEAAAAVTLLRFKFAGFLGDVTLVNDMDRKLAHLLTSEGVLLKPDSLQHSYCMASALMDGFIRNELIPRLFPNCPASAPPLEAGGKGIHVLGILVESLKTFDKDLMRCASFRSYKKPKVKVLDAPYGNVPRESVYDTELMRILSNWFGNGHEWSVTGQWHLQNDANKHEYSDIVLKKEDHPTIVLELLATEEPSFVQSHIEKTPERMELVSAEEAWVVHFTCEQDYHPIWQSDAELLQGVNVVHFAHDIDFTKAAMSARWKDRAGNTQQVDQKLIDLGAN